MDAHEQLQPTTVATAVEDGLSDLLATYARASGGEVVEADGVRLCLSTIPSAILNAAVGRPTVADLERGIARVASTLATTGRPWRWIVGPTIAPDFGPQLIAAGLRQRSDSAVMGLRIADLSPDLVAVPDLRGLEVVEVADAADLDAWALAQAATLGLSETVAAGWRSVHAALLDRNQASIRLIVARLDGRPVGGSLLYGAHGCAGIYNVCVVEDARGRGIGRAVTVAAVHAGLRAGFATAVLSSSPLGLPVYLRLGFVEVGRLRSFGPVGQP